jgi:hypothetical protein
MLTFVLSLKAMAMEDSGGDMGCGSDLSSFDTFSWRAFSASLPAGGGNGRKRLRAVF